MIQTLEHTEPSNEYLDSMRVEMENDHSREEISELKKQARKQAREMFRKTHGKKLAYSFLIFQFVALVLFSLNSNNLYFALLTIGADIATVLLSVPAIVTQYKNYRQIYPRLLQQSFLQKSSE